MARMTVYVLSLLVLIGAGGCSAARSAPKAAPVASSPTRHVLPNGIPLIIQEHRGSELVALQLWVRAGARDETPNELGLAHYLEHMLFRGTTSRPTGFVEREVEAVGGIINAGTSWDYTYYYLTLPPSRVAQGLELLADISMNAALDAAVLDKEKEVVLEEMRLGEDNPRRVLIRTLYSQVFEGHPYGRQVIGTPELIRGLTRDTLSAFYRNHYAPETFAVVVVGPVDPEQVLSTTRAAFGRLPRIGHGRLPAAPPPPMRPQRVDMPRAGAHAYLGLAWPAPRLDHGDAPAVDLLVSILGGQRSSRLVQSLREQRGLAVSVDAGFTALAAGGAVLVTAQLDPANLEPAEAQILDEIRRVRDAGVTPAELRRAITKAEAAHEFETETAQGRAVALGRAETIWTIEEELAYVSRLRSVSADQVRAVARRYLDPARYTRLALVPPR
ncbi:MAG TPA: pitrilysin family protein [Methylomirabilota bacterium]|nr:pitrilysin family protein [Methylomirabilota bacterium]